MSWGEESRETTTPSAGLVDPLKGSDSSTLFSAQTQTPVLRLGHWQEALGVLVNIDKDGGVITFKSFKITVPPRELEHLPELEALTGSRIGILRTDLPQKPLLVRLAERRGDEGGEDRP